MENQGQAKKKLNMHATSQSKAQAGTPAKGASTVKQTSGVPELSRAVPQMEGLAIKRPRTVDQPGTGSGPVADLTDEYDSWGIMFPAYQKYLKGLTHDEVFGKMNKHIFQLGQCLHEMSSHLVSVSNERASLKRELEELKEMAKKDMESAKSRFEVEVSRMQEAFHFVEAKASQLEAELADLQAENATLRGCQKPIIDNYLASSEYNEMLAEQPFSHYQIAVDYFKNYLASEKADPALQNVTMAEILKKQLEREKSSSLAQTLNNKGRMKTH